MSGIKIRVDYARKSKKVMQICIIHFRSTHVTRTKQKGAEKEATSDGWQSPKPTESVDINLYPDKPFWLEVERLEIKIYNVKDKRKIVKL